MNNFSAKPKVFHKDAATTSSKTIIIIIIIITIVIDFLPSAHNMCEVEPKLGTVNHCNETLLRDEKNIEIHIEDDIALSLTISMQLYIKEGDLKFIS